MKRATERLLVRSGAVGLLRAAAPPRDLILAYHNVIPDDAIPAADRSLHLPLIDFRRQLDRIARTHEFVPLTDVVSPDGAQVVSGRPRIAVTFDDAYRGAVTIGIEELAHRAIPATIFVAPGLVGGHTFWWDAFSAADGVVPGVFREYALQALRGKDSAVRAATRERGLRAVEVPDYARTATEAELQVALAYPALNLGSHTWSHPNLACLTGEELMEELVRPLEWLTNRFDRVIPWLAYPYGLSSPEVERAAAVAGYHGAFRVSGGPLPRTERNPFALPRLNVPAGLSAEGLLLRAIGLIRA